MNKRLIIFVMLVALVIPFVSAEQQTQGTFLQGSCVALRQTCGNCTYVNITKITAPDSSIILSGNNPMTKSDTSYNYTFCNTSQIGQYIVDWKANPDGITSANNYDFFITLTGTSPSSAQSIIYFVVGIVSVFIFCLSLYGAIKIKWKHGRNERGYIVNINDLRYVKLFLWFFTYLLAIFIAFSFEHISKIADWQLASNWMNFMFWMLISFLAPMFIITFLIGILSYLDAKKIDMLLKRGFKVR